MNFSGSRTCSATFLVFLMTAGTLIGAWGFQYLGGYEPCALCYRQRVPYYFAVPAAAVLLWVCHLLARERIVRFGLIALALVMLISAGLGGHHAGVEWGWWQGPDACAGGAGLSTGSVLPDLDNARVVSCTEVQWRMFGLSFAGWNAVISLLAAIIAFWGARRPASTVQTIEQS
ncbi:MAG: disulfide bond formation protein B [Hyphomicrobiales bacterium]